MKDEPTFFDFETRSRADIKRVGSRNYAAHETTELVCCVAYRDGEYSVACAGDPQPWGDGETLAAHNYSGFDSHIAARLGWSYNRARDVDTAACARKAGLPGALDALGTRWLNRPKDDMGSKLTRALSGMQTAVPKDLANEMRGYRRTFKTIRTQWPDIPADVLARVIEYCYSDVAIMVDAWPRLEQFREIDRAAELADRVVNDRGVAFDRDLARAMLRADEALTERTLAEVAAELNWTEDEVRIVAASPAMFTEVTGLPDAQKNTIAEFDHPLVRARQALASIVRGKLQAGLALVSPDGRLRDMHLYGGAHTLRWSGKGMQLHNLPRPAKRFEDWGAAETEALIARVLRGDSVEGDELAFLTRPTLCAAPGHTLAICDFSGVEARSIAWTAGDHKALDVFKSGRDPYRVMAATIFGTTYDAIVKSDPRRTIGKAAELACGYGMGAPKFEWTATQAGQDLAAHGVSADDVVKGWRKLHAPIVKFWYALDDAFRAACGGEESSVACFDFVCADNGRDIAIVLPSGRPLVYNDARLIGGSHGRPDACYHGHRGIERVYGGKLAENITQALCRDLMADALVRAELAGLRPVLHVHDEIVCEVPKSAGAEALAELRSIMTNLPDWARGFPVGAEGFASERYRK